LDNKAFDTRAIKNQFIRLLEKKKDLEPEYHQILTDIDNLNRQISGLEQALKAAGVDTYTIREKVHPPKPPAEVVQKDDTIPEVIYKMLKAYKKPLHYTEIWRQLDMAGIYIRGKDRANTTLAYISRNKDKFDKAPEAGRGFYKIKE